MSEPRVTITLGRSGQVVKKSEALYANSQFSSGGKRPMGQRFENDGYGSSSVTRNKRLRGEFGPYQPGGRIGKNDLRLKLMQKEAIKQMRNEVEARKVEEYRPMPRTTWSTERGFSGRTSPQRVEKVMHEDLSRRSYSSYPQDSLESPSRERVYNTSRELLTSARHDELLGVPPRRANGAQETQRIVGNRAPDPYMISSGPPAITARAKPMAGPPTTSCFLNGSYMSEQHQTVSGLLNALGLQKYAVLFQAEEVDMLALKQMGDKDLKDLGIPMGPRKKILLAVCPPSRVRPSQI
ncbi:protein bicaudal C homolog 1-A-like [Impatiens glandulifera]|uniref:protein bicaudal C homolog 1-A-like n=1 Tax=Impatiens glandulifera TaxID=253017 RepID=UPI001FB0D35B|nr:protein bicaudal C homolog 1-A-like [Impatiens glandulifera]